MTKPEDYADWIVKNADKRGTPEFDTVAKAYELAKQQGAGATGVSRETGQPQGNTAGRIANAAGQGFNNAVGEAIGLMPDTMAAILRKIGLPAPSDPNFYANTVKSGIRGTGLAAADAVSKIPGIGQALASGPGGPPEAQNWMERGSYGAGHGIGDMMTMYGPAKAVEGLSKAGGLTNAVAKAIAAQPGMQAASAASGEAVGQATENPLLGLATSVAVPLAAAGARRMVTPFPYQLTPEEARLAQVAAKEGIPLTAGQETGSRNLKAVESVLGQLPVSGGMTAAEQQTQREAFNSAVLGKAGVNAKYADPTLMQKAAKNLGSEFEGMSKQFGVNLDDTFLSDMQNVATKYSNKIPSMQRETLTSYMNDILSTGNTMPGETYQDLRSQLGKEAKSAMTRDSAYGMALKGVQSALDKAFERSVPDAVKGDFADLRQRYAAFKAINSTMAAGSADAAKGNISPARLWSSVAAQDRNQFPRGAGALNDLARVGQAFVKDQIPDSGTSQRQFITRLLTGAGGVGGAGTYALTKDPALTAAVVAAPFVIPGTVKGAMNAATPYLKNQIATGGPKLSKELIAVLLAQAARQRQISNTP